MNDIKVAIFEDNKLVRDALEAILNGTPGYVCCGAFSDGHLWESKIRKSNPTVILMDIEMPGINGIDLTKVIHETDADIKIIIQTVFNDAEKIFKALQAGASGYILKNDPPQKYLDAINEVCNGGAPMNSFVAKKVLGFFESQNLVMVTPEENDYQLSKREKEILKEIVSGKDLKLISGELFISYETLRTHVKNIYKKLHVNSRFEAAQKAIQQGLN